MTGHGLIPWGELWGIEVSTKCSLQDEHARMLAGCNKISNRPTAPSTEEQCVGVEMW